jgi:hypothetical protein
MMLLTMACGWLWGACVGFGVGDRAEKETPRLIQK